MVSALVKMPNEFLEGAQESHLSLRSVFAESVGAVPACNTSQTHLGSVWHVTSPQVSDFDVRVSMPVLLHAQPGVLEQWLVSGDVLEGSLGLARYRCSDEVMFVAIEICEQDGDIAEAARQAYMALFGAMAAEGFAYLARCWNYFSDINAEQVSARGSLERYRLFNIGRQAAFEAAEQTATLGAPAACALGTKTGPLTVYALAVRNSPLWIENPRQVSAYYYPQRYGPQSPTFSRASVIKSAHDAHVLFVSGTASIVGHETMHLGDVLAQTEETLRNIVTVVTQANLRLTSDVFSATKLCYKVFVRRAEDVGVVADTIRRELGASVNIVFLQADVCRAELLVEIEAVGFA